MTRKNVGPMMENKGEKETSKQINKAFGKLSKFKVSKKSFSKIQISKKNYFTFKQCELQEALMMGVFHKYPN